MEHFVRKKASGVPNSNDKLSTAFFQKCRTENIVVDPRNIELHGHSQRWYAFEAVLKCVVDDNGALFTELHNAYPWIAELLADEYIVPTEIKPRNQISLRPFAFDYLRSFEAKQNNLFGMFFAECLKCNKPKMLMALCSTGIERNTFMHQQLHPENKYLEKLTASVLQDTVTLEPQMRRILCRVLAASEPEYISGDALYMFKKSNSVQRLDFYKTHNFVKKWIFDTDLGNKFGMLDRETIRTLSTLCQVCFNMHLPYIVIYFIMEQLQIEGFEFATHASDIHQLICSYYGSAGAIASRREASVSATKITSK